MAELTRSLLILEGVCYSLDPQFNIAEEFEPYVKDLLPKGVDTRKLFDVVFNEVIDFEYIARSLPSALRSLVRKSRKAN